MVPIIVDLDTDDYTHMSNKVNKYIVIHYTGNATDTARNNAKYFKNGKRNASAHYFVDANEIVQIVKDSDASWGVGKKYGNARLWGKCTNANSINIEMCSTNGKIDDATMKNTEDLVRSLMARYNIPIQNVVRHYDVCAKRCPGWDGWLPNNESEWNRLIAMIQNTVPTSAEERQLVPIPQPSGVSGVLYKVTTPALNVRKDPNASSAKRGCIRDMGTYTITEICGNWGKLASGMGWICLDYAKRVGGVEPTHTPTPTPQPTPAPSGNPIIAEGQQHSINFTGQHIAVDGSRGPETRKQAVKVVQTALNLDYGARLAVDGSWGPATQRAFGSHYVKKGERQYLVTAAEILCLLNGRNPNGVECPGHFGNGLKSASGADILRVDWFKRMTQ